MSAALGVQLAGKVVVVTGGSRGIGRAIVVNAARRGARVAFCARAAGEEVTATLAEVAAVAPGAAAGGTEALFMPADVRNEADIEAFFDAVIERFGRVDVAVNNAGINRDALLVHTESEAFDDVIATNLTGSFLVARRALLEMLAQGEGGRIIGIGSISQAGATSQAAYAASKGGLVGLTRTIAKEYGARGITANLVVTGLVDTALSARLLPALHDFMIERSAIRRAGTPDEVAGAVLWLASDAASYVNGALLHASGGWVDVPW